MGYQHDSRVVLTLDAGGTNFVFSAVRGNQEVVEPVTLPSFGADLQACLGQIRKGFETVHEASGRSAAAISFAFPGPADYPAGIIGDLGNLPGFRGGVALGPMLSAHFGLPVFLNNDGDLFAYGEALAGLLPEVNAKLEAAGSPKRYRNLIGLTLGTGFGGGLVRDGRLFIGDNSAAGEVWLLRNKLDRDCFAEEGVSIRAVRRAYAEAAGLAVADAPEPKAIAERADRGEAAAKEAFRRLGEVAGDALANALTLMDGLAVIGGGLSAAAPHFMPALMAELNGSLASREGGSVDRLEVRAFDLDDAAQMASFLGSERRRVAVPGTDRFVDYDPLKRVGVAVSKLGASRAVALGAYAFALNELDRA